MKEKSWKTKMHDMRQKDSKKAAAHRKANGIVKKRSDKYSKDDYAN